MNYALDKRRFCVLSALLLIGLLVATLPVSYATWRQVLGVSARADAAEKPTIVVMVATSMPVSLQTLLPPLTVTEHATQFSVTETTPTNLVLINSVPTEIPVTITPLAQGPSATEAPPVLSTEEPALETTAN